MENRQQISNGACVSGDVQMITPNNTVPQKRGRGRPRKNPVANTTVNSTNTNNVQGGSVPFGSDSSLVHEPGNQPNRTVGSRLNPNLNSNPAPTPYHTPMQHNARYDIPSEMPFDEIRDDGSGYECVQDSMDEEHDNEPPLDSGEQQRKIANWLEILATNTDKIKQLLESLIESNIQGFEEMKRLVREGQGQSDEIDIGRMKTIKLVILQHIMRDVTSGMYPTEQTIISVVREFYPKISATDLQKESTKVKTLVRTTIRADLTKRAITAFKAVYESDMEGYGEASMSTTQTRKMRFSEQTQRQFMLQISSGDGSKKGPAYRCTRDRYSGWFDPFGNAKFRMFLASLQDAHILSIGMSPKEFPRLNVRQDTHGTNISSIPQAILAFYIYKFETILLNQKESVLKYTTILEEVYNSESRHVTFPTVEQHGFSEEQPFSEEQ
ncbi:hypothetical protein M9434_007131 [Picochlorum sp. BPE23]|nr:hypothetical protein M9434_007131 [Picochlorum sp. BPE23]